METQFPGWLWSPVELGTWIQKSYQEMRFYWIRRINTTGPLVLATKLDDWGLGTLTDIPRGNFTSRPFWLGSSSISFARQAGQFASRAPPFIYRSCRTWPPVMARCLMLAGSSGNTGSTLRWFLRRSWPAACLLLWRMVGQLISGLTGNLSVARRSICTVWRWMN